MYMVEHDYGHICTPAQNDARAFDLGNIEAAAKELVNQAGVKWAFDKDAVFATAAIKRVVADLVQAVEEADLAAESEKTRFFLQLLDEDLLDCFQSGRNAIAFALDTISDIMAEIQHINGVETY